MPRHSTQLNALSNAISKQLQNSQPQKISQKSRRLCHTLTSFSDSPRHLDIRVDALQLKNFTPVFAEIALASRVFPVPGGPNKSTPFQGSLMPVKYSGMISGRVTASFSSCLASSRLAMSSNVTCDHKNVVVVSADALTIQIHDNAHITKERARVQTKQYITAYFCECCSAPNYTCNEPNSA